MIDCSCRSSRVWIASISRGATSTGAGGSDDFFVPDRMSSTWTVGRARSSARPRNLGQPVLALTRMVKRFERRRGRAEHHRHPLKMPAHHGHIARVVMGRFLLFVGMLLLLVDDDDAEVFQRREHAGARADDDPDAPGPDMLPLVVPLARRQMAVQHGHAHLLPDETRAKMFHRLRRERDFRDEHERRFALGENPVDRLQVDLRLAAAGDAVQQNDARLGRGRLLRNHLQGGHLLGIGQVRCRLGHRRVNEGIAVLRLRVD